MFFNHYEPNVNATIAYLKKLGVKVNNATVNQILQQHPDWPSLLCLSDSLSKWNIPNAAGKIAAKKIAELPIPFIAYTKNYQYPLAIVTGLSATDITFLTQDYKKPITTPINEFVNTWDGVYLIALGNPAGHTFKSGVRFFRTKKNEHETY